MNVDWQPNWPRCYCGKPTLDGHTTCGEAMCNESADRDRRGRYPLEFVDLQSGETFRGTSIHYEAGHASINVVADTIDRDTLLFECREGSRKFTRNAHMCLRRDTVERLRDALILWLSTARP